MILLDRAVGIDLGTTHSEIALLAPSEREVVLYQDRFGRSTIPSAVGWDASKGEFTVGRAAKAARAVENAAEEISSKILAELVRSMRDFLKEKAADGFGFEINRAVITVPAYFDALQTEATRRAGEAIGLKVLGILQEPTAAAIYHTFHSRLPSGNFLVYDLGGGTFDVSVLKCVAGEYQVLAIDGDNFLGGDDFDRRLAELLRKKLSERGYKLDLDLRNSTADRLRFEALRALAEETKHSLSTNEVVSLSRQNVFVDQNGEDVSIELELGRAEYAELIRDLSLRTIECAERALAESSAKAGVGLAEIDRVVLVGGSTRVPAISELVQERLAAHCRSPEILRESVDTVVALGAAVHAAELGGLIIRNDAGSAAHFSSRFVTDAAKLRLALAALEPEQAVAFEIHRDGKVLAESVLSDKRTARVDVELPEDGEYRLSLLPRDAEGVLFPEVPFVIYRGTARPRPTALSRPSVTSKDLSVEVLRSGRRDRKVLIERGTGLPTETTQEFSTADQSGAVVLRILEGRVPIKTLALPVPRDTPIGTRVELVLRCDGSMRVEAQATVLGQKLWASVEPVENPALNDQEIEQLLADAEQLSRGSWGNTGEAIRREVEHLSSSVRETIGTDPAKLSAHATRLRRLVADMSENTAEGLGPSLAAFDAELHALKRLVYRTNGTLVGMDRDAWDKRLAALESRAERARVEVDAVAFRRVYNEVQALLETAQQEEFAARRLDDPAALMSRASGVERWIHRIDRLLNELELSRTPELLELQRNERNRLLGLLSECRVEPIKDLLAQDAPNHHAIRRQLEALEFELERLDEAALRVPSLGLVSDRGPQRGGS
jgi:molecular chaperone DnaK